MLPDGFFLRFFPAGHKTNAHQVDRGGRDLNKRMHFTHLFCGRHLEQWAIFQVPYHFSETAVPLARCACHSHLKAETHWHLVAIPYGTVDIILA